MKPNSKPHSPEHSENSSSQEVEIRFDGLDEEVEVVEGKVSEVAKEQASEQGGAQQSKSKGNTGSGATQSTLTERELLREKLLAKAPAPAQMRQEVKSVLLQKKNVLEKEIGSYRSQKEYHLLSDAIAQLRAVVRQLEIVAHASYELLKEIWLKVVQKFA